MITTVEQLLAAHPSTCSEVREWLDEQQITSLADAWDQCRRSDWMLWLDERLDLLTDAQRRLIACRCVRETPIGNGRTVWDLLTDDRSRHAVVVAERYAVGEATDEQLADAVDAAAAAAAARAYAAYAAARAAAAAAARAYAAYAAARAADTAADAARADAERASAADAAAADAMDAAREAQADIIRAIAGNPFREEER